MRKRQRKLSMFVRLAAYSYDSRLTLSLLLAMDHNRKIMKSWSIMDAMYRLPPEANLSSQGGVLTLGLLEDVMAKIPKFHDNNEQVNIVWADGHKVAKEMIEKGGWEILS